MQFLSLDDTKAVNPQKLQNRDDPEKVMTVVDLVLL